MPGKKLSSFLKIWLLPACLASVWTPSGSAETLRDGKNFDPGAGMDRPAEGAPPELARMTDILGTWDVSFRSFDADSLILQGKGMARITLSNRGHSITERFHLPGDGGDGLDALELLIYNPGSKIWMLGSMNTHTESVDLYTGRFEGESLVLLNAKRRLGSTDLVHYRYTFEKSNDNNFRVLLEESRDGGTAWSLSLAKSYTRWAGPFPETSPEPYGTPAPGLPEEARQFDFLEGEWDTIHEMSLPTGQVKFPVHATAVHTLDGHAILEFNWYDVDPRLPDASTTVARIYNRAMRRWECMFVNNRFHSILHFGGVKEGDRIVLHRFGAHTGDVPLSYWIFSDMKTDSYRWHAETSRDRGRTSEKTWIIDAVRVPAKDAGH